MTSQIHIIGKFTMRLLFLFSLVISASAIGREQQPADTTTTGKPTETDVPKSSISIDELQLQLAKVQEATNLSEDEKTKTINLYTQAIQQLEIAKQFETKAAEYQAEREKAPATLQAIKEELAQPLPKATANPPSNATRTEIEASLRQAQNNLEVEKKTLSDWERERDRRTTRRKEIPDLLVAAKLQLQNLTDTTLNLEAEQSTAIRSAQKAQRQSKRLALEKEIDSYNSELSSYDARRDLLQLRISSSARKIHHLEELAAAWQALVQEKGQKESEAALREAREQLKVAHPAIRPLVEEREKLALNLKDLQVEITKITQLLTDENSLLSQVNRDFDRIKRRVAATGLTNDIGKLLRKHRGTLPRLLPSNRNLLQHKDTITNAQLARMELEDQRREAMNAAARIDTIMTSLAPETTENQKALIHQAAEEALLNIQADRDTLIKEYDRFFDKLVELAGKEIELVTTINLFKQYIDENILWIKSGSLPGLSDAADGKKALTWLLQPANWMGSVKSLSKTFRESLESAIPGVLAIIVIWLISPSMAKRIRKGGETVNVPTKDSMWQTLIVLLATAMLILRWPVTLWVSAYLISAAPDASAFSKAVAHGFNITALIALTLQSLRQLIRHNGLAEKHFRWNVGSLSRLKKHLYWLTAVLVPTFFVFATLEGQPDETAKDSLGRFAFTIAFLSISLFAYYVLRPSGPVLSPVLQPDSNSWLYRLRHMWYLAILVIPVALVISAILGYYYTALYLGTRFIESIWLLFGLIVLRSIVDRWLMLQTRRRLIAEARERAAQKQLQMKEESSTPAETESISIPEEKLDVAKINEQTLKLVRMTMVIVGFAALWGIWAEALPALRIFREVQIGSVTQPVVETVVSPTGEPLAHEYNKLVPITLANLGLAVLAVFITVIAVKNIPGLLEISILQRLPIDAGGRFAATTITRYTITVTGLIIAFMEIGIGWSKVQWLVAAITVGLGFGLQEIFANLVSGLMLLFERPIRIGDIVTVADTSGTVTRIRVRATTIVGWDRKELVIPNKEFITGNVVNWSLSDSILRLVIPVGIAYGSDTRLARELLNRIATEHPNVLDDPAPRIFFKLFGESSLDFEVRVYVGNIDHYLSTIDEINDTIDQEFRKHNIEIAFPQRDIHIRSINAALPVINEPPTAQSDLEA